MRLKQQLHDNEESATLRKVDSTDASPGDFSNLHQLSFPEFIIITEHDFQLVPINYTNSPSLLFQPWPSKHMGGQEDKIIIANSAHLVM